MILEAIRAGVGLGLGPRLVIPLLRFTASPVETICEHYIVVKDNALISPKETNSAIPCLHDLSSRATWYNGG